MRAHDDNAGCTHLPHPPISGELEYRIHGQRGDAPTINFATKNGGYQKPGAKMLGTGFLDGRELEVDEGGNFEILVSARRPPCRTCSALSAD